MKNYFPPLATLLDMDPEAVAPFLLIYLNDYINNQRGNKEFHMNHVLGKEQAAVREYSGGYPNDDKVMIVLTEAWGILMSQNFLSPAPSSGMNHGFVSITRKGQQVKTEEDFKKFAHLKLLSRDVLDPELSKKAWTSFVDGDFEMAIFAAFKEVEVRMRNTAGLDNTHLGTRLAREVFDPQKGQLTDITNPDNGEKQAYSDLFAGAIGVFKNPTSHRPVNYDDPVTAVSLILFANTLLKVIDERKP